MFGCSRGVTIKHCQKTLQKQGIAIKTIGVGGKKEVWDEAEKNIDQLIRHDAGPDPSRIEPIKSECFLAQGATKWV